MSKKLVKRSRARLYLVISLLILATLAVYGFIQKQKNDDLEKIRKEKYSLEVLSASYEKIKNDLTQAGITNIELKNVRFCKLEAPSKFAKKVPFCGESLNIFTTSSDSFEALQKLRQITKKTLPFASTYDISPVESLENVAITTDKTRTPDGFLCGSDFTFPLSTSGYFFTEEDVNLQKGKLALSIKCRMYSSISHYELLPE